MSPFLILFITFNIIKALITKIIPATKNTSSIEMKAWTTGGAEITNGSESFDWVACGYWK